MNMAAPLADHDGKAGRIYLEAGHRVVAETVRARIFYEGDPEKREAVDVKADDFDGVSFYVSVSPEEKNLMRVALQVPCFKAIKDAVGEGYFAELFGLFACCSLEAPMPGFSLTVLVNLDALPASESEKEDLVSKLSTLKREVVGAPLWVCFRALLTGSKPPRSYYVVPYRPAETMYVVPSDDLVVVVYTVSFDDHVERAIANSFLQEIVISRRQSRELASAPTVNFSQEPPHELKTIPGLTIRQPSRDKCVGAPAETPPDKVPEKFVGYLSLAISKRIVESGRLEKAVTLTEGYRSFLMYHVQATKSQLHARIRRRAANWLQVLNRAMPEKLNVEKKTIKGRTFNRAGAAVVAATRLGS